MGTREAIFFKKIVSDGIQKVRYDYYKTGKNHNVALSSVNVGVLNSKVSKTKIFPGYCANTFISFTRAQLRGGPFDVIVEKG